MFENLKKHFIVVRCNICRMEVSLANANQKSDKYICVNCKNKFNKLNYCFYNSKLFENSSFQDIDKSLYLQKSLDSIRIEEEIQAQKQLNAKIKAERNNFYINNFNKLKHLDLKLSKSPAKKQALKDILDFTPSSVTPNTSNLKIDNFIAIDTETTGLSATQNEIIEIAAIKFEESEPIECLHTLIKPKNEISDEIININHITNEMVENAPKIEFVIEAFNEFIENYNIVAYNTEFDIKFLHKNGIDFFSKKRTFFDTMQVCKKYYNKNSVANYKLDTICKQYGIERFENHRALEDALATGIIFNDLAHKIKNG